MRRVPSIPRSGRVLGATVAAAVAVAVLPASTFGQAGAPMDKRKAVYASWSPDQMKQRRKKQGLVGPGTERPFPAPAFPSYLKRPDSIEGLMPQARAAARQSAGRVPLGLIDPGKT